MQKLRGDQFHSTKYKLKSSEVYPVQPWITRPHDTESDTHLSISSDDNSENDDFYCPDPMDSSSESDF